MKLVMLLWCYSMAVFTDPGRVPENWRPIIDEEENEAQLEPLSTPPSLNGGSASTADRTTENGSTRLPNIRYCRKCSCFKPPRSHHCSVCEYCLWKTIFCLDFVILKLDFCLLFQLQVLGLLSWVCF